MDLHVHFKQASELSVVFMLFPSLLVFMHT